MFKYRHGDVGLFQVNKLPDGAEREDRKGGDVIILAEGEVTGHTHRIANKTVTVWHAGEQRYIEVPEPAILDHEEHGPVTIEPGVYQVLKQREYTDVGLRNVVD